LDKLMKRATGIGGVFFKARNPKGLSAWYEHHLGLKPAGDDQYAVSLRWRELEDPANEGMTVWALFPHDTEYFNPSRSPFMINYRVDDLDALLEALRAEGVTIDPKREEYDYGRFAWIMDPEGNRIELWEPPKPPKRS
jgi:predicted enzyme related to lactoylglutathione lyase